MQIGEQTVNVSRFLKHNERDRPVIQFLGLDLGLGGASAGSPLVLRNFTNLYIKNFPAEWDEEKIKTVLSEERDPNMNP